MVWWTIQLASLLVNWDEDEKSFKHIPEQLTKCGLGAKHSFQNSWEANQNWLRFTCARSSGGMSIASLWFARRPSTSSTCCESEEENKVRRLCCDGCHWENSTLKKYMYGTTARREKKSKTTLNAYWFRQILDKNDDEYATQATFSLSYFDAMTHIMRAEPIPNDVKFHIILGQNCMKTQAKYDFFPKTPANFHIILCMLDKKRLMPPTRNEV